MAMGRIDVVTVVCLGLSLQILVGQRQIEVWIYCIS